MEGVDRQLNLDLFTDPAADPGGSHPACDREWPQYSPNCWHKKFRHYWVK